MLLFKVKVIGTNSVHLLHLYTSETQRQHYKIKGSLVKDQNKKQNYEPSLSADTLQRLPLTQLCH